METINELITVLAITAVGICAGFIVFIFKHEKERKKEIRKTNYNKN